MSKLTNLPEITFAEKDAALIEKEIIQGYEDTAGVTLTDADPRKKLLQSQVPVITGQRSGIDKSAKRNLLAYADGDFLDHLGILVGCTRIPATDAITTLKFTLSKERTSGTIIPTGTRVTAGDNVFFSTDEILTITAGHSNGTVKATCLTTGVTGNNYPAGTLITIVDPVAYVSSVTNITDAAGGVDEESDDDFRERIQLAPESFSTAGPDGAYEYWAKTASSLITDAKPYSPSAGCVDICVLMQGGELPSQEILDKVLAICSDEKRRPLTDNVSSSAPTQIPYDIDVKYYISKSDENIADSISKAVETAVEEYKIWQKSKLGRHIDPSELSHRMKKAGASRVIVTSPVDTAITKIQVAKENDGSVVKYEGIDDDE